MDVSSKRIRGISKESKSSEDGYQWTSCRFLQSHLFASVTFSQDGFLNEYYDDGNVDNAWESYTTIEPQRTTGWYLPTGKADVGMSTGRAGGPKNVAVQVH